MESQIKTSERENSEVGSHNLIVQEQNNSLQEYDIDAFLEKRKEFITKVNKIMVEGKDYHVIQGKKSLAKGGAEKIASIFGWSASFNKDQDVAEAFTELKGLISFVCRLEKSGVYVGEGRGASTLAKNGGDPNKTIKMAQKSAFIDATLRTSGLSDFFTQDLEDMPEAHITQNSVPTAPKEVKPLTDKQNKMIKALMKEKGVLKLSDIGIEPITNPTVEDGKYIIDTLLNYHPQPKSEADLPVITIDEPLEVTKEDLP